LEKIAKWEESMEYWKKMRESLTNQSESGFETNKKQLRYDFGVKNLQQSRSLAKGKYQEALAEYEIAQHQFAWSGACEIMKEYLLISYHRWPKRFTKIFKNVISELDAASESNRFDDTPF
jgi:hypothetical protein